MKPSSKLKYRCVPKLSYVTNAGRHVGSYLLIPKQPSTVPTIYQTLEFTIFAPVGGWSKLSISYMDKLDV